MWRMPGMDPKISRNAGPGSSPATKTSEQRVWPTVPVATRSARSGRSTKTELPVATTARRRTPRRSLRIDGGRARLLSSRRRSLAQEIVVEDGERVEHRPRRAGIRGAVHHGEGARREPGEAPDGRAGSGAQGRVA